MFRALSVRNYRLYAGGQVVSTTGTWMGRVTQDWLVYHILTNDSSFALGFVTALQFLPALLLGMYGGVLGDRYPKRRVLICTQAAMAAISLLSGVLIAVHLMQLWTMCVIALVFGIASAIDMPVRQAFVVEMVGREALPNAVSLNSATFNLSRMLGPAIAGVLIEAFGTAPAFFCNAVSYLAVIAGLVAMVAKDLHPAERIARARGQLLEGVRYVRRRPKLMLPVLVMGFIGVFGFNFQVTNALMAQGAFGRGAGGYGMLSTMQAVGSLGGALLAARRRHQPRARLIVGAAAAFAVFEAASSFMPTYALFMALLVPTGAAAILLSTAANTILQLGAAPHMQGRVMALYTTVFVGSAPLGSMFVGWLGGVAGPRSALLGGGVLSGFVALACAIYDARAQRVEVTFDEPGRPHVVASAAHGPAASSAAARLRFRGGELAEEALVADTSVR